MSCHRDLATMTLLGHIRTRSTRRIRRRATWRAISGLALAVALFITVALFVAPIRAFANAPPKKKHPSPIAAEQTLSGTLRKRISTLSAELYQKSAIENTAT